MSIQINFESIIEKVVDTVSTKTVIGDPLEFGEITLIPVMNAYFGFGGGGDGGGGKGSPTEGSGAGGGGGARLKVVGMVVLKDGEVSFLPTGKGSSVDKIVDSIPGLIDKVKVSFDKESGEKKGEEA